MNPKEWVETIIGIFTLVGLAYGGWQAFRKILKEVRLNRAVTAEEYKIQQEKLHASFMALQNHNAARYRELNEQLSGIINRYNSDYDRLASTNLIQDKAWLAFQDSIVAKLEILELRLEDLEHKLIRLYSQPPQDK